MTTTTYYDLNIVEGTDIVNPLTVDNPNYETIDEVMHDNAIAGVTLATEIANATVHAITRENSECAVIRFIATSEWKAGDSVTVDGVPVTALLPSGETLPTGAYVINANVLCILTGTNLTIYAERKKTDNANEIAYNETTVGAALTVLNSDLTPKSGTVTSSATSVYLQRVKVKQIGKVVYVSFGVLSPEPNTTSSLTLSGVSLPSEQVDFPICDANIYGRGYVSTNGRIGINLSGAQTGSNYAMCNFSYVVD